MRTSAEFQRAKTTGRRVRTPHFVLVLAASGPGRSADGPRLGIVASRRIGNAVTRNRAKRLVREAFRATRELFHPRLSIIVIVTHPPGQLKRDDVVAEWQKAAARIQKVGRQVLQAQAAADAEATG